MSSRLLIPPRFVPTLTDVIETLPVTAAYAEAGNDAQADGLSDDMAQQVATRVSLALDAVVRAALPTYPDLQTDWLVQVLNAPVSDLVRRELESALAVRQATTTHTGK